MNDESNTRQTNEPGIDAEEILDGVLQWVCIESPSHDAAAVDRMADRVQHDMGSIGAHVERIPRIDGFVDVVKARTPWGGAARGYWCSVISTRCTPSAASTPCRP